MANRAVKQPNGKYARFSEVVDDFTHMDCERDELLKLYAAQIGREEAIGKLDRADAEPHRFDKAIEVIRAIHGADIANERWEAGNGN